MAQKKMKKYHVISNTHWDREWRYGLWQNRLMLVELMDNLIDLMEKNTEYRHYILDGQSVVIQDYLEVRPENKSRLEQLINAGRIQVGPWYTLPHQFAVTGESLVRNLLIGIGKAKGYGKACTVGYTIFSFGQVSQLPQIYAGFGIDVVMTCKRVSAERAPFSEFMWESPDGTRALTTRYGDHGRGNYFYFMFVPALFGMNLWDVKELRVNPDWDYDYSKGGRPCRLADNQSVHHDTFLLDPHDGWHPELIKQGLKDVEHTVRESTVDSPRLYSESADFIHPTIQSIKIVKEANSYLKEAELVHSNVEDFMAELKDAVDYDKLKIVTGELRDGPAWAVQGSINSAGIPVRLANYTSETYLIAIAEPLAAITFNSLGCEYPTNMLSRAWEFLLKAHPHDSINGYGVKSVWTNTVFRLEQARDIAEALTTQSIQSVVKNLDNSNVPDDSILLTVFNTLPQERDADIEVDVDLPDKGQYNYFKIIDDIENEVFFQILDCHKKRNTVVSNINRPLPYNSQRFRIRARFENLPPCGYKTYRISYHLKPEGTATILDAGLDYGSLLSSSDTMENEHLRVVVNPTGTLNITRKATGHTFSNLLSFEDRGEAGDALVRKYPLHDSVITSDSAPTYISIEEQGPLSCAFKIKKVLTVPAGLNENRKSRTDDSVNINVEYIVRLIKNSESIEVELQIDNVARNHILSMVFPTFLKTDLTHADSPYDVVTRKLADRDRSNPQDKAMDECPCYSFVDINDGSEGLAILTGGLQAYELRPGNETSVALPLIRAYDCTCGAGEAVTNYYPEWEHTQALGRYRFNFAIFAHSGNWDEGGVSKVSAEFCTPVKVAQHGKGLGTLPMQHSWFSVKPDCIRLSAIKKAEKGDNIIVRIYNPTDNDANSVIIFGDKYEKAWVCDLNESHLDEIHLVEGKKLQLSVKKKKVITLELSK